MRIILQYLIVLSLMISNMSVLANDNCVSMTNAAPTDLHTNIITFAAIKHGMDACVRKEIMRGTNLVFIDISQGKIITHAFPVGELTFLEHDSNGDGVYEQISILQGDDVLECFIRSPSGKIEPLPSKQLNELQRGCAIAWNMMTNLVSAVTNKNTEKVENIVEDIRNLKESDLASP